MTDPKHNDPRDDHSAALLVIAELNQTLANAEAEVERLKAVACESEDREAKLIAAVRAASDVAGLDHCYPGDWEKWEAAKKAVWNIVWPKS